MDSNERRMIEELFAKLGQAEERSGPRDADAERQIREAVDRQPAAPYYMSQVILVQEQAIEALNRRVQELEGELAVRPASGGGFLGGLFGGGASQASATARTTATRVPPSPAGSPPPAGGRGGWSSRPAGDAAGARGFGTQPGGMGGGGFMAGALSTAAGVAGGVLLANALTGLFSADEAQAAEAAAAPPPEPPSAEPQPAPDEPLGDEGTLDEGGDLGGFDEW